MTSVTLEVQTNTLMIVAPVYMRKHFYFDRILVTLKRIKIVCRWVQGSSLVRKSSSPIREVSNPRGLGSAP